MTRRFLKNRLAVATALVQLRARLAVAGGDPEHPAHDFAVRRYERLANQMAGQIAALPEGEIGVDLDASGPVEAVSPKAAIRIGCA